MLCGAELPALVAYGDPTQSNWNLTTPYGAFTFLDLHYVVNYQQSQLIKRGIRSYATAPQAILAASEQHWDANPPNNGGLALAHYLHAFALPQMPCACMACRIYFSQARSGIWHACRAIPSQ